MKKTFSILLASLLLVFTLTACGGDRKDSGADADQGGAVTAPGENGNADQNGNTDLNGPGDDRGDGLIDGGEAGEVPGDDALTGGTDTGTAAKQNTRSGASYDQMLRNGRVHDTDGMLWDHENATTPGSMY